MAQAPGSGFEKVKPEPWAPISCHNGSGSARLFRAGLGRLRASSPSRHITKIDCRLSSIKSSIRCTYVAKSGYRTQIYLPVLPVEEFGTVQCDHKSFVNPGRSRDWRHCRQDLLVQFWSPFLWLCMATASTTARCHVRLLTTSH
jgi:hypothetical protein